MAPGAAYLAAAPSDILAQVIAAARGLGAFAAHLTTDSILRAHMERRCTHEFYGTNEREVVAALAYMLEADLRASASVWLRSASATCTEIFPAVFAGRLEHTIVPQHGSPIELAASGAPAPAPAPEPAPDPLLVEIAAAIDAHCGGRCAILMNERPPCVNMAASQTRNIPGLRREALSMPLLGPTGRAIYYAAEVAMLQRNHASGNAVSNYATLSKILLVSATPTSSGTAIEFVTI